MTNMSDEFQKTKGESLSYQYFLDKAKKITGKDVSPEVLMFVQNLVRQFKYNKAEAATYVTARKALPNNFRNGQTREFLTQVNSFLSEISEAQLDKILRNPKEDVPMLDRVVNIIELASQDSDIEHRRSYAKGIVKLVKDNFIRRLEKI